MWTERERIIDNFEDAITYIKQQHYFHDYLMGNIEIDDNSAFITIKEYTCNIANKNAHVWNFKFNNISNFKCEIDSIVPFFILEVFIEDHEITFSLNNGYISFKAKDILLGIPKC